MLAEATAEEVTSPQGRAIPALSDTAVVDIPVRGASLETAAPGITTVTAALADILTSSPTIGMTRLAMNRQWIVLPCRSPWLSSESENGAR